LANEFPGVKIDFLTIPKSRNLLESNPNLNNLIIFDKRGKDKGVRGLIRIGNVLKNNYYDVCITPHRSLRSAFLSWMTKADIRIGFNRTTWQGAFTHLVTYESKIHETDRNLSLLSILGLNKQNILPTLYSTENERIKVETLLRNLDRVKYPSLFAVAPGSIWPTKRWPEDYYKKFCHLVGGNGLIILLVGGPEDHDICQRIASHNTNVISMAGKLSLCETYYLLSKCSGILTNDSAPLHLGMAAKINVFSIFGPTVPEFGFAPFGQNSKVFENRDLACRPCSIHGSKKCPIKTFECMESLNPDIIASQVLSTLKN
jgi:heptosyltransferase-2